MGALRRNTRARATRPNPSALCLRDACDTHVRCPLGHRWKLTAAAKAENDRQERELAADPAYQLLRAREAAAAEKAAAAIAAGRAMKTAEWKRWVQQWNNPSAKDGRAALQRNHELRASIQRNLLVGGVEHGQRPASILA